YVCDAFDCEWQLVTVCNWVTPPARQECNTYTYDGYINTGMITATITPASVTVCQGQTATLTANPGLGYTYQWISSGTDMPGETNQVLYTTQAGTYTVRTFNGECSKVSPASGVVVNPVPPSAAIAVTASTQTPGAYSLSATPATGYNYQWQLAGLDLAGQTTPT